MGDLKKDSLRFFKQLGKRVKNRDLSGTGGQAIKNSGYKFASTITAKVGSLVFMAILARLLMPELFGIYSLTLSTIIFLSAFSNLGVDSAMVYFTSRSLKKSKEKAAQYFSYLFKIKLLLVTINVLIIVASSYFIATYYFQKPIFIALLAGAIYLPLSTITQYIESTYLIAGNFRIPLFKEILFQITRFIIVPSALFFLLKQNMDVAVLTFLLLCIISLTFFVSALFLLYHAKKIMPYFTITKTALSKKEKREIIAFIIPLSTTVLAGVFFGYVDTLMLGRFVDVEFVGFYNAAFSIVMSLLAITGFLSVSIFPIFLRSKKKALVRILRKSLFAAIIFPLLATIFVLIFSDLLILIVYGSEYLTASLYLRLLAIVIPISAVSSIYDTFMVSQGKTYTIAKILVSSTLLNIILNYFFISYGLQFGMNEAVIGACIATIISRIVHLVLLSYVNPVSPFKRKTKTISS